MAHQEMYLIHYETPLPYQEMDQQYQKEVNGSYCIPGGGWLIRHVGWHIMKDVERDMLWGFKRRVEWFIRKGVYSSLKRGFWYIVEETWLVKEWYMVCWIGSSSGGLKRGMQLPRRAYHSVMEGYITPNMPHTLHDQPCILPNVPFTSPDVPATLPNLQYILT